MAATITGRSRLCMYRYKCARPGSPPRLAPCPPMKDLLEDLMGAVAGRADYAEARHVHTRSESISTRNGAVDDVDGGESEGVGVRVRSGGAWGFAATRDLTRAGVGAAFERALAVAAAQPMAPAAALVPEPPARGRWESRAEIDPFEVPLEEKLALLVEADGSMRGDDRIAVSSAHLSARKEARTFASTEGALCEQLITETGAGMSAMAVSGNEVQVRSFPCSHEGDVQQAGFEHARDMGLAAAGPRVAEEALALLTAPACEPGTRTIVL